MKNIFMITFVILLLISCKDSDNSKTMEVVMDEIIGNNEDINQKYDLLLKELSTKTLLTDKQLLEAFPKKLGNLNVDSTENGNNDPRITASKTVVGSFGDQKVRLEILDAAEENAYSAIIPLKMLHINKVTSEYDNTIRHSKKEYSDLLIFGTDRDEAVGADYEADIRFLYDNRFYVTIEGKGMDTDALWNAINVDDFKRFKEFNN